MFSKTARASVWLAAAILLTALAGEVLWAYSRRLPAIPVVAFVPQTAGAMLWDVEHFGAAMAAEKLKLRLYWNAPTSENDMAGQVALIDKVARGRYQGLVLAPNQTLGVLAPLRRALAAGLPVVVVSSQLDLPASSRLGYIVNDDEKMGELAAAEVARLIRGRGSIALVGLARYSPGVASRVRSAECFLASRYPDIHVVSRVPGTYDTSRAEDFTNSIVAEHPDLKAEFSKVPFERGTVGMEPEHQRTHRRRLRLGTGHPDRHVGAAAQEPDAAATDGQSQRPGAGDDLQRRDRRPRQQCAHGAGQF